MDFDDILDDIMKRLERVEIALGLEGDEDEDGDDEEYDVELEEQVGHTKQ
tara:strand:+ start:210 stop:359 length:150 start_codon:yes stop_codon:yes gene_type:complete